MIVYVERKGNHVMKKKVLLCAAVCAMILAMGVGCSEQSSNSQAAIETTSITQSANSSSEAAKAPETSSISSASSSNAVTANIYIGAEENFKEYPCEFDKTPTPDQLIAAIAEKTGWNLTLADVLTTGKGGITVSFSKESALFTGPPEPQKEEFYMYDAVQLDKTILDSIQKTLQNNLTDSTLGDPSKFNVFYSMEGDKALELPNVGVTIPLEQSYSTNIWNHASNPKG